MDEELQAMLKYMVHHNIDHTNELKDEIASKLKDYGYLESLDYVNKALAEYEKGNELLKKALEVLK